MKEAKNKTANKNKLAFTIVEALVFLFIFSITTLSFYKTFTMGTNYILETKKRVAASELVNEKMEIIRSLDYSAIGISGGADVSGDIASSEIVSKSGLEFVVETQVSYVDDNFDGTFSSGTDDRPNDYKRVTITVSWGTGGSQHSSSSTETFSAIGVEPAISGGMLSINVLDNEGNGISGATIKITNNSVVPNISDTKTTGADGNFLLIGAPASDQAYKLAISKSGYFSVETYPPYSGGTPVVNYLDLNASVFEGALSSKSITTDEISGVNIYSEDVFGSSIPDSEFDLKGGKKISQDIVAPPEIGEYHYYYEEESLSTGSSGEKNLSGMSSGTYFFTPTNNLTNYTFISVNPSVDSPFNFVVSPGNTTSVNAVYADKNINSILVKVKTNDTDKNPIEGAEVRLKNDTLLYDVTLVTDNNGYVFFPENLPELEVGDYELSVSATGFSSDTETVSIDKLSEKTILLNIN